MSLKKPATENAVQIGNLLSKYRSNLQPPQASIEKAYIKAVDEVLGLSLTSNQVSYTVATKTIFIQAPSIIKTEIKRKQPQILSALEKHLPNNSKPETVL